MRLPASLPALLQQCMPLAQPAAATALSAHPSTAGLLSWCGCRAAGVSAPHSQNAGPAPAPGSLHRPLCTSRPGAGSQEATAKGPAPPQTLAAAAKLATLGASVTRSGYRESRPQVIVQSSSADDKVLEADAGPALQRPTQQPLGERPVNYYKLVRALFADEQIQKAGGVQLDKEAVIVLKKLVGSLTKEGKRSKANRILLDALHLIRESAAKDAAA